MTGPLPLPDGSDPRARTGDADPAAILDLFEELAYAGEITPDGHYVDHASWPTFGARSRRRRSRGRPTRRVLGIARPPRGRRRLPALQPAPAGRGGRGGHVPAGRPGRRHPRPLGPCAPAAPSRTAARWCRASSPTSRVREEADARLAEASDRFTRLLDVVGEHVYLALAFPDGRMQELFQGPGADRLLGGAEPDAAMENWDGAVHPGDRTAYEAFNRALTVGEDGDVEYRLIGADGITRWVHDRAATRRRPDGTIEISGIVSDVTERRRMRAELAEAHAALSRVVEAMDDHLFTLRVQPDGSARPVYRGPNREALAGGAVDERGATPGSRSCTRTTAHAGGRPSTACRTGEPVDLEYRVIGLDGVERIMLEHLRPRREPGRNALLRRRHARHQRAPEARGRTPARPRRGRATRPHRRAHRRVQPAPLRRDRRRGAERRRARVWAAADRRRPLQAGQRRARPHGRRRGARRALAPAPRLPGDGRLPRALGRRGVRRAAAGRGLGRRARPPRAAAANGRRGLADSGRGTSACGSRSRSAPRAPAPSSGASTRSSRPPIAASTSPSATAATASRWSRASR